VSASNQAIKRLSGRFFVVPIILPINFKGAWRLISRLISSR